MSRDQVSRRGRRLLDRLSQSSSAPGLAALLALPVPQLAEHAPAIVDLALTVVAIGAAIVAMAWRLAPLDRAAASSGGEHGFGQSDKVDGPTAWHTWMRVLLRTRKNYGRRAMTKRFVLLAALFSLCALLPSRADALRLVTYAHQGEVRLGAVADDQVIDLNRAYQALLREQGDPRPEAMAEAIVPPEMVGLLEGGGRSMEAAREAVAFAQKQPETAAREQGMVRDVTAVQLKAPIPRPTKITLMGFNYKAHAEEMLEEVPEYPLLFSAYPSVVNGPNAPIVIPKGSETPDYEAEFGVVIGKAGRNVSPDEAMDHVAGYVIVNDATDRAWQSRGSQYLIGKSVEGFKVMGPYLVTKDEIADPHDLAIKLWVNDEVRQDSNTSLQVFKIWDVISYMSTFWTLEPGDVLSTGTAPGVGHGREPPVYLKPGDEIRIEISGLGVLESPVVAAE